ncbi:MAG: DUF5009 domain-containing protein [Planctomycetota bacterium]|nr:DUF5009 domain-containing protein [Planctomycetota bacterium]
MPRVNVKADVGDFKHERLQSLDAYRGLIMVSLAFAGFGLAKTASNHLVYQPDSEIWQHVHEQFSHAEWVGCSYWDLIQPSFMFMVGVSMAYSYSKRQELGHSYPRMFGHAFKRALLLIALSVFLMSKSRSQTDWSFMNVLAQIGLAYPFLFLLWRRSVVTQSIAAAVILLGTSAAYEFYPDAGIDIQAGAPEVGVTAEWSQKHLDDIRPPWHKNANIGLAVDLDLLNRFERPKPFVFNSGGYQTINFIPSLVTMLFGLMCGELLRTNRTAGHKLAALLVAGFFGLGVGYLLNISGACPLVKRLWTPSWALFSTGCCCLILGGLYLVVDVMKLRRWSFPLVVVGMNSIAIYCMSMSLKSWTAKQLQTHFGQDLFLLKTSWFDYSSQVDAAYSPTVQSVMVGLVFWLVCFYMYRNKLFIRL